MASKEETATKMEYEGERRMSADGKKVIEEGETSGVNPTFAAIMAQNKPNPWGRGHLMLYVLCTVCFLNSTMSGMLNVRWPR